MLLRCRRQQQGGWLLLELLLAWMVAALVLVSAYGFFSVAYAKITQVMETCHRVTVMQKWLSWLQDALDQSLAQKRCGTQDRPRVEIPLPGKRGIVIHSCRWLDQQWQWVDGRYYVRAKRGVNYLYEKLATKPAVAWIPGIDAIKVVSGSSSPLKTGAHQLEIYLRQNAQFAEIGINPRFLVTWYDPEN